MFKDREFKLKDREFKLFVCKKDKSMPVQKNLRRGFNNCYCQLNSATLYRHKSRSLRIVISAIAIFSVLELLVSLVSHSMALEADACHMLFDAGALGLALMATHLAQLSVKGNRSSEHANIEIIAALINGVGLLAMSVWIGWEALNHLQGSVSVIVSPPMLITAIVGLLINGFNLYWLWGDLRDLNLRGVFLHVMVDVLGSVGVLIAAAAAWLWHWIWVDAAVGLGISVFIILSAIPLVYQSWQALRQPPSLAEIGLLEVGSVDLMSVMQRNAKQKQSIDN